MYRHGNMLFSYKYATGRKKFLRSLAVLSAMGTLSSFKYYTYSLAVKSKKMPVLFTSHGNDRQANRGRSILIR